MSDSKFRKNCNNNKNTAAHIIQNSIQIYHLMNKDWAGTQAASWTEDLSHPIISGYMIIHNIYNQLYYSD